MIRISAALIVLAGLAGCTWSHPYKGESEFYADKMECQQYAQGQVPQQQAVTPTQTAGMTKRQMGATYGAQVGNSLGQGLQQGSLFRDCMMSKGYR